MTNIQKVFNSCINQLFILKVRNFLYEISKCIFSYRSWYIHTEMGTLIHMKMGVGLGTTILEGKLAKYLLKA